MASQTGSGLRSVVPGPCQTWLSEDSTSPSGLPPGIPEHQRQPETLRCRSCLMYLKISGELCEVFAWMLLTMLLLDASLNHGDHSVKFCAQVEKSSL